MENHLHENELAQYAEALNNNEVDKLPDYIIQHISECDTCANQAVGLSYVLDDLQQETKTKIKRLNINNRFLYLAASLIFIVVIGGVLFTKFKNTEIQNYKAKSIIKPHRNLEKRKVVDSDTIITDKNDIKNTENNLIADNFNVNMQLEKLVKNYESAYRSDVFEIVSKSVIELKKSQKLILEWKNESEYELIIEIFDNKAESIYNEMTDKEIFEYSKKLESGIYYWKLYNQDFDLLFCGKIVVR